MKFNKKEIETLVYHAFQSGNYYSIKDIDVLVYEVNVNIKENKLTIVYNNTTINEFSKNGISFDKSVIIEYLKLYFKKYLPNLKYEVEELNISDNSDKSKLFIDIIKRDYTKRLLASIYKLSYDKSNNKLTIITKCATWFIGLYGHIYDDLKAKLNCELDLQDYKKLIINVE